MSKITRAKRGGPKAGRFKEKRPKEIRVRKCLVTGETYPAHMMIRFVLDPEGHVIPDVAAKLPGRGGWIRAEGQLLESAMKKKTLLRFGQMALATIEGSQKQKMADVETVEDEDSVAETGQAQTLPVQEGPVQEGPVQKGPVQKFQVTVDDNLPDLVAELLRQRCLNFLGLVNRAGLMVSGFEKVRALLQGQKCRALITAEDAADNGRSKLCSGLGNVLENLRMIDMFTREQLGQTLGLPNAVHVALLSGGMTESFLKEFSRYEDVTMR